MKYFFGVLLVLFAQQTAFSQLTEANIKNTARYVSAGRYQWNIYVDAGKPLLNTINYVQYTLHPTFKTPIVYGRNAATNFNYSAVGWGEFMVGVRVVYKNKSQQVFQHWLRLR